MRQMNLGVVLGNEHVRRFSAFAMAAPKNRGKDITGQPEFNNAARVQLSFLAPLEKRCLAWLAKRMPERINSDHLTLLGFLAMLCAGLSFWLARSNSAELLLVPFWLGVNWFGDSLDGTLARMRNQQRPKYGFYVDHMVDTFGAFFLLGGMALSGYMSPALAVGLLIVYFMLAIEIYLATYTLGRFHLSAWKIGPTELRILLGVGSIALYHGSTVHILGNRYRLFDVGGVVAIAGIAVTLIIAVIRHTHLLYSVERIKSEGPRPGLISCEGAVGNESASHSAEHKANG